MEHREQAEDHLIAIEEKTPDALLEAWKHAEREWEEKVLHIEDEIDLESPNELKKEHGQ